MPVAIAKVPERRFPTIRRANDENAAPGAATAQIFGCADMSMSTELYDEGLDGWLRKFIVEATSEAHEPC